MPALYAASACNPMAQEGKEETADEKEESKATEGVEELVSQVAQVVENVQETITDASKEVQSLIFPEVSIQESSTSVGSSFEEGTTLSDKSLSDKSWKKELNGHRLTGQTSDIRLNTTNDDISVDPSIETIEKEGDILIGFDQHVRKGEKKQRQKSLVDPYQMSLILDGVAVQSLTLGAAAMKMINDMISDAKGNVTTCDVLNGGAEQEQLEIDLKNSLSVEENEVVHAPPTEEQPPEEQDSSFIHPLILEKLNSFVEQAMVNIEQAKTSTLSNIEHAKTATMITINSTSDGIQKANGRMEKIQGMTFHSRGVLLKMIETIQLMPISTSELVSGYVIWVIVLSSHSGSEEMHYIEWSVDKGCIIECCTGLYRVLECSVK